MKQFVQFLILAGVILIAACSASHEQEAKNLIHYFYQAHQSHPPNGALSLKELLTFRRFLSVPLFDLLKDVSVVEEERLAQTGNQAPPLVDGDLFTTHPQNVSTYRVLGCEISGNSSICPVELIYRDAQLQAPLRSIDRVVLTREANGWVIDNIEYDQTGSDSRSGTRQHDLQRSLRMILGNSTR